VDAGEVGAGHRVTALYELVLPGTEIPLPEGAPAPKDGEPYSGAVEVSPDDLVLVKVRYKHLDATEEDPALEVATSLAPADVADSYTALDGDFQWALVVASFAEILKESPYADPSQLDLMGQIIASADHAADADRTEFATLFGTARTLLGQ
jgi:Ca-activated chloride channel family protein